MKLSYNPLIDDGLDRSSPPTFSKLSPSCNGTYSGGYHYHHGLKAGEGTLEASLVRLLVRGMNRKDGAFDQDTYLEDYIKCVFAFGVCVRVYVCMYGGGWVGGGLHCFDSRRLEAPTRSKANITYPL